MKSKANVLCSVFIGFGGSARGGGDKGPATLGPQQHLGRMEARAICAESGTLLSQLSKHTGANGYRGILDPTQ